MAEGGPPRARHTPASTGTPEDYESEVRRVATFLKWPLDEVVRPNQLASAGFIYTGEGSLVHCYCCGARYRDWHKGDNPLTIHQKCNPRCSFLQTLRKPSKQPKRRSHLPKPPGDYNGYEIIPTTLMPNSELKEAERSPMSEQVAGMLPGQRQQQQKEISIPIKAERKELPSSYPTVLKQLPHNYSQVPLQCHHGLTSHPNVLEFPPDNNPLPHHMTDEESELEDRGGIYPFKVDTDSELDQPQQIQAEKHIDSHPPLLTDSDEVKKPDVGRKLKYCNVDFSNLWTVS